MLSKQFQYSVGRSCRNRGNMLIKNLSESTKLIEHKLYVSDKFIIKIYKKVGNPASRFTLIKIYFQENLTPSLTCLDLLKIAIDIARGCQHLEEKHFIHRYIVLLISLFSV